MNKPVMKQNEGRTDFVKTIFRLFFVALVIWSTNAGAIVLDFEDLPPTATTAGLPANYYGFEWWTFDYHHKSSDGGVVSGDYALNNNAATTYIDFQSNIDFNGAYFADYSIHQYSIVITGYDEGVEKYEVTLGQDVLTNDAKYFELDFLSIDYVTFHSPDAQFFMDDLYINESSGVSAPPMMLVFLVGFWLSRTPRRRPTQAGDLLRQFDFKTMALIH